MPTYIRLHKIKTWVNPTIFYLHNEGSGSWLLRERGRKDLEILKS